MKPAKALIVVALFAVPLLAASARLTQDTSFSQREQNFREFVTLRADVKTERKHIITQMMQFNTDEAAKFWPIFYQYDAELNKIADGRIQLIVDYARNYENLSDDQAGALMTQAFELEAQRAMLKKKYFDKMKTAIGATQAAKFYLIENQIQHILDLQISAELPTMQTVSK
jgi:hypothetical protein